MQNMIYCNNCGRLGHQYHQCKLPITSYGVIAIKIEPDKTIKYLFVRRKDSLGYVDFLRGKYPLYNIYFIKNVLSEMTNREKIQLYNEDFKTLWENLWGETAKTGSFQRVEEKNACDKLRSLREGIKIYNCKTQKNDIVYLQDLITSVNTNWNEPEWGFPKGRRNHLECDIECALREWEEESGLTRKNLNLIQNLASFEETFMGSNYKSYKHKYYVALYNENIANTNTDFDKTEIGKLEWKDFDSGIKCIRPYNTEKIKLLMRVNNMITNYIL